MHDFRDLYTDYIPPVEKIAAIKAAAVDASGDGILGVNTAGRIIWYNPALAVMFGYDATELQGEFVEILIPEGLRGKHATLRKEFIQNPISRPMGQGRPLPLLARRKDGTAFEVQVGLAGATYDGHLIITAIIRESAAYQGGGHGA